MKYWLPLWLATFLFGWQGFDGRQDTPSTLASVSQDSGAKLIGGLAPPGGEDGPDAPEENTP